MAKASSLLRDDLEIAADASNQRHSYEHVVQSAAGPIASPPAWKQARKWTGYEIMKVILARQTAFRE
jgi:hypothetical protein